METLVQGTLDRFGRIDALVNIAGAVPQIDLFEMTDAQWEDGLALKLCMVRAADDPGLGCSGVQGGGGADFGKRRSRSEAGLAAVAKDNAAIIALAKAFAEQGVQDGVQANSVVPGAIMTGRRRSFQDWRRNTV